MLAQIIFAVCLGIAGFFIFRSARKIYRNIHLGRDFKPEGPRSERIKKMLLVAFGQSKMFHRPIPAILHLFIYIGFLIVNLEMLEIIIDGLFGTHRVFAAPLGRAYPFVINVFEFFAVSVIIVCGIFLYRRNVLRIKRFHKPELKGWPFKDGNVILVFEIILMCAFLNMNATDLMLQQKGAEHYHTTGSFFFSGLFYNIYHNTSIDTLIALERISWWIHIIGVMVFANYLPYSKHLHILLAFPNTYFSKLDPAGKFKNMPAVTTEVKSMLGLSTENTPPADPNALLRFGAKDVQDLNWKNLLDAYTCTECGRCTAECPANITGKKLSPRKIMMDTRDRAEEVGRIIDAKGKFEDDGKTLIGDPYITKEELLACTTCNACVEACPVNINPLEIILELRRYMVMEESKAPNSWNAMFGNVENNQAPWKFPAGDRLNWKDLT
ncbi:MAG TPA: (Fe-S)-binding protein [Cytophagales bacterium]|nr:(Fe-S)-binding protein [Cytophagales bacterium]